jgi:hypothetical protein
MTTQVLTNPDRRTASRAPLRCVARPHEIESYEDKVRAASSLPAVVVPPTLGDIGEPLKRIELEPMPETVPAETPAPVHIPAPVPEPEKVPA